MQKRFRQISQRPNNPVELTACSPRFNVKAVQAWNLFRPLLTSTFGVIEKYMKVPDKKFNDISEQDLELTQDQIFELKRRIKDLENLVKYVIYSDIIPKGRWRLFLNISDDTWCDDINAATLFKRQHIAKAVVERYSEERRKDISIAKISTKNDKRKVLKYLR
jgi:hypothetical protein